MLKEIKILGDHYSIEKKEYTPNDKPILYYEVKFEKLSHKLLGQMLTHYGARKEYYSAFVERCVKFNQLKRDRDSLKYNYTIFNDESSHKLGELIILADPEYYTHVYYRYVDDVIILNYPALDSIKPAFYKISVFLDVLYWWQDFLKKGFR